MIFKYKPSSFFKGISNKRLKTIFGNAHIDLGIDWDKRKPEKDTKVAEAWSKYVVPQAKDDSQEELEKAKEALNKFKELQEVFQRICVIVQSRTNSLAVIKRFAMLGKIAQLPPDFSDEAKWSKAERGAYIYLTEGFAKLEEITEVIYAEDISYTDHMVDYETEPTQVTITDEMKESLKTTVGKLFDSAKRGNELRIETYPLGTEQNFFFVTMDGQVEHVEMRLPSENGYELKSIIRPYSVIFTYDSNCKKMVSEDGDDDDDEADDSTSSTKKEVTIGKLSLYALNVSKQKRDTLASKIMEVLFAKKIDVARIGKPTYKLNYFAKRGYQFPDVSAEGIVKPYIKKIGICVEGADDVDEMVFSNYKKTDAYASMERCFKWCQVSQEVNNVGSVFEKPFSVSLVSIVMTIKTDDKQEKEISFDLRRNSCNMHNYPEDVCKKIKVLLEKMDVIDE